MVFRPAEKKQFGFAVSAAVHAGVAARADKLGMAPTTYAKLLFEAGYAARIGQERSEDPADAELDEQVRLVFAPAGQADTAAIARATGVPEPRVVKILEGWRTVFCKGGRP